ncbi:hypothetical protein BLEM_1723 [Bifidobacterium lemurum]|uniref:Uncharacterized protein n=1 Tax=Bifidobacterium lemurum TaxID=1603886 RepID=A0A261FNC6_9BIFI|nr:hypothetical protein [Bifidobacterium lemurum]OZG60654.1 hypothetical protein BLEM_1723 [Bifidobacterium lemurum]QOL34825.1 hypothetical protein BL8807_02695 [Bifidobacterium lemurum]
MNGKFSPKYLPPLTGQSICSRHGSKNHMFWYPQPDVETLEKAFLRYVAPQFFSKYQAAQATEDFIETLNRAKQGDLEPVYEIRLINPATTKPERIFEIKNHWNNAKRSSKTAGYVGSRLFHGEPYEIPNGIVATWLMCKVRDPDADSTWNKQSAAAKQAAFRLDECRRHNWKGLVEM